jgi:hypothetical protein
MYVRTHNRFNNSPLLHLPKARANATITWKCRDNQDDHHTVFPHAPEHMTDRQKDKWDSYAGYRSHHVEYKLSLESLPVYESTPVLLNPTCLLYAATSKFLVRFLDHYAEVTRPIRRGSLYTATPLPRKTTLGQHLQKLSVSLTLPGLVLVYFNSPNRTEGLRLTGSFALLTGTKMTCF